MTWNTRRTTLVARLGFEGDLARRTLTNPCHQRPGWQAKVHASLDAAVAVAQSWDDGRPNLPDDDILRRLLALNRERAGK